MTTHVVETTGRGNACADLAALDDQIIALLARRRELAQGLPMPPGPRAVDPAYTGAVRDTTLRYVDGLGSGGELVARSVLVLCHSGGERD
ncbi:chorismate mutase [Streptomyces canus]|uniref:chorismate mutase n=1 Tax=Streptomyces canus TaxID=58343 RepID=UPI00368A55BE